MDRIIHSKARLNCSQQKSFEMYLKNDDVQTWLAEMTAIEPYVGGKCELFWDTDNGRIDSAIDRRVTAIEIDRLLCIE